MKRQTSQKLGARRREAANLALKGWTQAAIASHSAVLREIARCVAQRHEMKYHFDARKGPLGASPRIILELCVSLSSSRAFSDFPTHTRAVMAFENHTRKTTQVIARQSEAARSDGSRRRCRRLK